MKKETKERIRIRKSKYIEFNQTYYYIDKFNMALSLFRVLEVALCFFEDFSEVAAYILQLLKVIGIYFLEQKSNLQSLAP